jgi:hypothetical protein
MAVTGAYDPANESREAYNERMYNQQYNSNTGGGEDLSANNPTGGMNFQLPTAAQSTGANGFDPINSGMTQIGNILAGAQALKAGAGAPGARPADAPLGQWSGDVNAAKGAFAAGQGSGVTDEMWIPQDQAKASFLGVPQTYNRYNAATGTGNDYAAQQLQKILGGKVGTVNQNDQWNPALKRPVASNIVIDGKQGGSTGLILDYAAKYGWEAAAKIVQKELNQSKSYDEQGNPIDTEQSIPESTLQGMYPGQPVNQWLQNRPQVQYPQVTPAAGQGGAGGAGGGGAAGGGGQAGGGAAGGQGGQLPGQTGGGGGQTNFNPYNPYAPGGGMQGGGAGAGGGYNPFAGLGGGQGMYGGQSQYSLGQSQYGGQQQGYSPFQYNLGSAYGSGGNGAQAPQSVQQMLANVLQLQGGARQAQLSGPSRVRTPLGYTRWNRGPQTNQYMQGTYPSPQGGMQQMQQLPPQMQQMLMAQLLGGAGMQQGG